MTFHWSHFSINFKFIFLKIFCLLSFFRKVCVSPCASSSMALESVFFAPCTFTNYGPNLKWSISINLMTENRLNGEFQWLWMKLFCFILFVIMWSLKRVPGQAHWDITVYWGRLGSSHVYVLGWGSANFSSWIGIHIFCCFIESESPV